MTEYQLPSAPGNAQEGRWRCLVELALPVPLDSERLALTAFLQSFQALRVPTAYQERLKTALVEAVARTGAGNRQQQPAHPVLLRMWTLQFPAASEAAELRPRSEAISRAISSSPDGWGFFLLERNGGELPGTGQATQDVVELFLYQEGEEG